MELTTNRALYRRITLTKVNFRMHRTGGGAKPKAPDDRRRRRKLTRRVERQDIR